MVSPSVVVVIPTHKSSFDAREEVSIRQCLAVLGRYPIRILCPSNIDTSYFRTQWPEIGIDTVDPKWMASHDAYSKLMTRSLTYELYKDFEFQLTYQTDAFVFDDQLPEWCAKDIDFVGAPWFEEFGSTGSKTLFAVGNSGLCLRRNAAFSRVLKEWTRFNHLRNFLWKLVELAPKIGPLEFLRRLVTLEAWKHLGPEDIFWGIHVPRQKKWFRVPTPVEAAGFAFEVQPDLLYEMRGRQLPFGCHAWWFYDLEFWRRHIEKFGHRI